MLANTIRTVNGVVRNNIPLVNVLRHKTAYSGDGKTSVQIINQDYQDMLMIKSYANFGFRLNNGITVLGPMAIFPRTVLSWQVQSAIDVTPESLRLFALLQPKLDLLIIGLETNDRRHYDKVFKSARINKINVEILPTTHAVSTFNFLNAEGRAVGAALIPPTRIEVNEDDMLESKLHYDNLYKKQLLA